MICPNIFDYRKGWSWYSFLFSIFVLFLSKRPKAIQGNGDTTHISQVVQGIDCTPVGKNPPPGRHYCTSCKWIGVKMIPIHWNMFSGSNELCHEYHEYPSIARKTWRQSLRFFVACFLQACRDIRRYLESHTTKPLNHKRKSPHLGNWVSSVQTEKGLFVQTCLNRKL